jgi:hypothetical protein
LDVLSWISLTVLALMALAVAASWLLRRSSEILLALRRALIAWKSGSVYRRHVVLAFVVALPVALFVAQQRGIEPLFDLDREIPIDSPEAQGPKAAALMVLSGRVVEVEYEANGNWEVGVEVAGFGIDNDEYDVELDPDLKFVRFDD